MADVSIGVRSNLDIEDMQPVSPSSPSGDKFLKPTIKDSHIFLSVQDSMLGASKPSTLTSLDVPSVDQTSPTIKESPSSTTTPLQNLRKNFIRKVLVILFIQLSITSTTIGLTFFPELGVRDFMATRLALLIIMAVVLLISLIIFACNRKIFIKVPYNYLLLLTFTIAMSYILGALAAVTESEIVLYAGVTTIIMVIVISLYACKTKTDLTRSGTLMSVILTLLLLILISGLTMSNRIVPLLYSSLASFVFGLHLAFCIQRLSGAYESKYSIDDYIVAALDIYIDIVQIFMVMLQLIQRLTSTTK